MSTEEEQLLKEAKKLPWEERLMHKNWKVRNDANIDLASLFNSIDNPKDPRLRDFGHIFKKTVSDSNAVVQEKALDALLAFLRVADADAGKYAKEVCDSIVAKCLTGRPKTVDKAQAALLLWIELEATDAFLDAVEKAMKNKVAKAVVTAVDVMFQALSEFGTRVLSPKRILKMLPDLFDHQDQNVRASSKGLTLELCRWIGDDSVRSILFEKMRDTMKKELESEVANVTCNAKPSRKIRSEQEIEPEVGAASAVGKPVLAEESAVEGSKEIDEYELVVPVDILAPLDKSGFWDGVKAAKWSERRDAVAELTRLSSAKKIAPGDFTEVFRTLKKLVTDVNIVVAVEAVQAIGNLARGLRNHFSGGSHFLLPLLLERLKEKKPAFSEALTQALQAMCKFGCLTLADVVEDVSGAVKNKVPLVRSSTLSWITYCIEVSDKAVILKSYKEYLPICLECLNDGTPEVRDSTFLALAAMAKSIGMKPLERSLEKLDDVRRKKLAEMIGTCGPSSIVSSGQISSSNGRIAKEVVHGMPVRRSAASMLSGRKPGQPASIVVKKPVSSKVVPGKKGDMSQTKATASMEAEDIEPGDITLDEIESRLSSLVNMEIISQLKSGVWKERLQAMVSLKDLVEGHENIAQMSEILIRFLCVVPGWNEKNVQVQLQAIEIISIIASRAKLFPKRCVVLCLLGISERVADIKTRSHGMKCLTTFSEAVGVGFVFERLFKIMKEHKNPKVLSEGIAWMASAVDDFGISYIKLKDLIDFCKDTGLQSSAPATRNSTIKLIGILHKFVGADLKRFLSEIKPALLTAIEAEFEKNPYEGVNVVPKRIVKVLNGCSTVAGGIDGLPREDISSKITLEMLKGLSSSEWKIRLESIEAVNKVLEEANKRIQPAGTGELFLSLKARLSDNNKNLVVAALATVGGLARALGSAIEKSSKGILADVLKCLCDNKKQTRESVLATLDDWVAAAEVDKMMPYVVASLTDTKIGVEGRKDLFDWLTRNISKTNDLTEVLNLLKPTASALADKSAEIRKAADATLKEIITLCGHESVAKCSRELHGPTLSLLLERLRPFPAAMSAMGTVTISKHNIKSARAVDRGTKHATKIAQQRMVQPKQSRQGISTADLDHQTQSLVNTKDSFKEDRERLVLRKYKFEELRMEQVQELENDLVRYFREDLHKRLLSTDFKRHVEGIDLLQKAFLSSGKELIEVIDVLLRWLVQRFCESNTTCLLKMLEFLPELVKFLKVERYILTEQEASIFFPCWIEKLGHNIEKVREKMRELTKQYTAIYSASKLFPYVLEGLRSKNNRTRIECVDLVGHFIDHHIIEIGTQLKSLQLVAGLTSERDGEIRKAALNTLAAAYKNLGDDVWKYVGKLSDGQRSMLDERFKWKAREMERKKEGKPGDAHGGLGRSVRDNGLDLAGQSEVLSRSLCGPLASNRQQELNMEGYRASQGLATLSRLKDLNEAVEMIFEGSLDQSVEGMKIVYNELTPAAVEAGGTIVDNLVINVDRLVSCLATKVPMTFNFSLAGASSRSCKYVLSTLVQIFQIKKLAHAVGQSTLCSLITELLLWLLDERVRLMDDGGQLVKALNVLMLKILDNADRTLSFVVLFSLLQPVDPSRWPVPVSDEDIAARNQNLSMLVTKCLIKLTKVLASTIFDIDLDRILHSIHMYLQELGMEEIRRRAATEDRPLRLVKTVLHELVKLRGIAIKGHLSMVPIDTEPQPIILTYIDLNLQTIAATRMLTPSGAVGQTHWSDSASNTASALQTVDIQLKQELASIFKKIGDKQTCSIGLSELYRITQLYPQADIFAQLQNASDAFRTYIRDGLAQMESNSSAGRMPGNFPIASPPPVILPKFAMPSPMPSISANVSSSGGDKEGQITFDGSARLIQGGQWQHEVENHSIEHPPVTSETLDAIRERMKSIRANSDPRMRSVAFVSDGSTLMTSHVLSTQGTHGTGHQNMQVAVPLDEKALSGLQARMERLKCASAEQL